jgi:serralysin
MTTLTVSANVTYAGAPTGVDASGAAASDSIAGSVQADTIDGNGGADIIGGPGADTLAGNEGDDTFFYTVASDFVAGETVDGGAGTGDTLRLSVNDLGSEIDFSGTGVVVGVEKLQFDSSGNAKLSGTSFGTGQINSVDGLGGADTMFGRAGNDIYVVANAGDIVSEASGSGIDTVISGISFSLVASARVVGPVEKLILTGTSALAGAGNTLANTITGNGAANLLKAGAGNDVVNGGGGNDQLLGEAGNDTLSAGAGNDRLLGGTGIDRLTGGAEFDLFVFNTAPSVTTDRDLLVDFNHFQDTIQLDNAVFTKVGPNGELQTSAFFAGTAAHDADDRIIYNKATGALVYDTNGNAAGGAILFATLLNKPADIAANDFVVI